jgi:hypothetical protein
MSPTTPSELEGRIAAHLRQMAPHVKERATAQLLQAALEALRELQKPKWPEPSDGELYTVLSRKAASPELRAQLDQLLDITGAEAAWDRWRLKEGNETSLDPNVRHGFLGGFRQGERQGMTKVVNLIRDLGYAPMVGSDPYAAYRGIQAEVEKLCNGG